MVEMYLMPLKMVNTKFCYVYFIMILKGKKFLAFSESQEKP